MANFGIFSQTLSNKNHQIILSVCVCVAGGGNAYYGIFIFLCSKQEIVPPPLVDAVKKAILKLHQRISLIFPDWIFFHLFKENSHNLKHKLNL